MSALVEPAFNPTLAEVDFGTLPKAAPARTRSFDALTTGRLVEMRSDHQLVTAVAAPIPRAEKKDGYRIAVTLAGDLPVGEIRALVSMTTDDAGQPSLAVPVTARVAPEITLSSTTLVFSHVSPEAGATRSIDIQKQGSADLAIESVRVEPAGAFTTKVDEVHPGQSYRLFVGIPADARTGFHRATIFVRTNCSGESELRAYAWAVVTQP
jgi:hypothetical protein